MQYTDLLACLLVQPVQVMPCSDSWAELEREPRAPTHLSAFSKTACLAQNESSSAGSARTDHKTVKQSYAATIVTEPLAPSAPELNPRWVMSVTRTLFHATIRRAQPSATDRCDGMLRRRISYRRPHMHMETRRCHAVRAVHITQRRFPCGAHTRHGRLLFY